jgi:MYXO-CTERM domain-containing protein
LGIAANGGAPAGSSAEAGTGAQAGTGGTPASSGTSGGAKKASGCSCQIAESSSRSTGWASLGLFALAWLRLRSRRRQAH